VPLPVRAAAALAAAALLLAGCGGEDGGDTGGGGGQTAAVERVVDGDTLVLAGGERVRLTGVDAPESVKPGAPVECYGPQASAALKALLDGERVRLEDDVETTDDFGRRLAWVFRASDGAFVNAGLIRDGFAVRFRNTPNQRYTGELIDAERQARREGAGLWSACPTR
jgi:micrococcal nuclease